MNIPNILLICATFTICISSMGETDPQSKMPAKEDFHLFLLVGQSNMAGRGVIEDSDRVVHPRILALGEEGKWVPAVAPIHFDKKVAGVGLGKSFAMALAEKDENITIGLIPAACGGSPLSSWEPGGYHDQTKSHPYDDAIVRARRAMQDGVLKGILWHQGESDSKPGLAEVYQEKLEDLILRFRSALKEEQRGALPRLRNLFGSKKKPFIIGQLGRFPGKPWNEHRERVNAAHIAVAGSVPRVLFVSSEGLTPKSDNVHFDTSSLRIFGKRYAEAYLEQVE